MKSALWSSDSDSVRMCVIIIVVQVNGHGSDMVAVQRRSAKSKMNQGVVRTRLEEVEKVARCGGLLRGDNRHTRAERESACLVVQAPAKSISIAPKLAQIQAWSDRQIPRGEKLQDSRVGYICADEHRMRGNARGHSHDAISEYARMGVQPRKIPLVSLERVA